MSLYDVLFDFTFLMCKEFPQWTPLSINKESATEMILFFCDWLKKMNRENNLDQENPKTENKIKVGGKEYFESNGDWIF